MSKARDAKSREWAVPHWKCLRRSAIAYPDLNARLIFHEGAA